MAKEKTSAEMDQTVEEKLIALNKLQITLSEIDQIRTLRGELPLEVEDLEDEIAGLETRLGKFSDEVKRLQDAINDEKGKILKSQGLLERYKQQLDDVRNNREYSNLTKESEFQELEIQLSEKKIREYNNEVELRNQEIVDVNAFLAERKEILAEKSSELDSIINETRIDEDKLRERAKRLEAKTEKRLLMAFKRIRKGANNGLAVVPIDRDACGGCFNKIPPQKQFDVLQHKRIIVCEYCGRIIVDPNMGSGGDK